MSPSEIIEIIALIFWSFQLIPQIYLNYKSKQTTGLSPFMFIFWSLGSIFNSISNLSTHLSILYIIQPNLFLFFSIICYSQCYFYSNKSPFIAYSIFIISIFLSILVQLSVYLFHSTPFTIQLFNSLSLICFFIGFMPQLILIYKNNGVFGISRLFLCIDLTGALLSIIAIGLNGNIDFIVCGCFIVVFVLDFVILMISFK
eukprot:NODE_724_length_4442_cov_0.403868.p1 type:complete len:201 gc:universal NODE_724_length_4442_cov_0.403868:2001-1399(-)